MLMKIRVFQIDHEKDEKNLAFRDYQTAITKNGRIDESIYKQVYGGEVPCRTLEEVYALCNGENKPLGYIAESMSVSNVVEVTQRRCKKSETKSPSEPWKWSTRTFLKCKK